MDGMFEKCLTFTQSLVDWDVSLVLDMSHMFYNCTNFDPILANWDILPHVCTESMFEGCNKDQDVET